MKWVGRWGEHGLFSGLVSFFSGVHFCFECYMAPFTVGGDSSAPEHSRSVEQSLGAGQDLRWVFFRKLPEDRSPPEPLASSPVQSNCTNLGSASAHREFLSSSCIFSQSTSFIVCCRPTATFSAWCFLGVCISRNPCTSTLLWTRLGAASCFLEEMGRKKESRFNSACFLYLIPALSMAFWFSLLLEVENLEDLGCVRGLSRGPCFGVLTCPSALIWCRLAPSRCILQRKAR